MLILNVLRYERKVMIKMFRKILCAILIFIMTAGIAACSRDNKEASGQKSGTAYSETEIGKGSGIKAPGGSRINSKGGLLFLDRGDGTTTGLVTLDAAGKPAGNIKCSLSGYALAFTFDAKDNSYVLYEKNENGNTSFQIEVLGPDGKNLKNIDLSGLNDTRGGTDIKSMYFTDIVLDMSGNIYLDDPSNGIQVLDKDGKFVRTIGSGGYRSMDIGPDGNLLAESFAEGKNIIEEINASTGKSIWSADLAAKSTSFSLGSDRIRYSKKDNCIYVMDSQGISKYDMSGKPAGGVLDFRDHAILASGYGISDMCLDASGNIYVTALSANTEMAAKKYEIYKYSEQREESAVNSTGKNSEESAVSSIGKNAENGTENNAGKSAASKEQTIITVSIPSSDSMLDMATSRFQQANPGYKVNIETYPSQNQTGNMDAYVKNLNTRILSGKGPDMMSVSWLPFKNYVSKKIFADLGEIMANDPDFDVSKYCGNIIDALKVDGKLYVLPTDFCFYLLMANQAVLDREDIRIDDSKWTWNDFKAIAHKVMQTEGNENLSALPSSSPNDLLDLLTNGSYSNYADMDKKSASFASKGFIDLLDMVKDFGSLSSGDIGNDMISALEAAQRGTLVFYPYVFNNYSMYAYMEKAYNDKLGIYKLPTANGSGEMTFRSSSLYAINANSKYKPECWELLKTFLSDEVQMSGTGSGGFGGGKQRIFLSGGFSVNRAAQQQKARQTLEGSQSGSMTFGVTNGKNSISFKASVMAQKDIDYIDRFIDGIKTYAYYDENIDSIIQNETKTFFSGAKSAEDTAKLIQDRVSTYLGE
jgi:multiple sugar transport system substrate-binding protein